MTSLLVTSIESLVERFWEVEEPDEIPSSFTEEGKCEEIFSQETYHLVVWPIYCSTSVSCSTYPSYFQWLS